MLTKPPPRTKGSRGVTPVEQTWTHLKDMGHYQMPMRSEYEPEWVARLDKAKYPKHVVVIDFENYFDDVQNMKRSSTIEYIMHPRFENLGVSVLEMRQPFTDYEQGTHFWTGEVGVADALAHLKREYGNNLERCTVVAQNAAYDMAILSYRFDIHPPFIIDVLGLARHWNSRNRNDLATLAKRYGLPDKGQTEDFKGATFQRRHKKATKLKRQLQLPLPRPIMDDLTVIKLAEYANNDVMREWELFTILLPKLSDFETELRAMHHTLELFLKPSLRVDCDRGEKLTEQMEQEVDRAIAATASKRGDPSITRETISGDKSFEGLLTEALELAGDDVLTYMKSAKTKSGQKLAIAKDDDERDELLNHPDEYVRLLMEARTATKSWPLHIGRIRRIMDQSKAAGGYLPVPLKYCGAHTGRWSGGEKINLQNLGSRGQELVNAVREMIVAPAGKELVIADASQIEARVLAWIAGQWDLVEKFGSGTEIYCDFAQKVLGYHVRKPRADGPIPALEAKMKWARNSVGKIGILGSGYGMGADKAMAYSGNTLDKPTAVKLIATYRRENDQIVKFWNDLEKVFIYTMKYGEPTELPRGLKFYHTDECDVIIVLPSGRELKYPQTRVRDRGKGMSIEIYNPLMKSWGCGWGGVLTENVVQAISRDILWGAINRMEDLGRHVAHHVHDEIILVVDKGQGKGTLEQAITELSRRPAWAQDCPLGAEGVVTARYGAH